MHEIKKIFLILSLFILLSSCGVGKALAPQKKSGSDEFLVKKKSPLIMPPSYEELPTPSEKEQRPEEERTDIKKILTGNKSETLETDSSNKIENLILKEINKN